MSWVLLIYYKESSDLLRRLINIFDGEIEDDYRGLDPEIVKLLNTQSKKHRIPLLTEADYLRVLNNSKSLKVERLPALLLTKDNNIEKIVYLSSVDEFQVATKL